MATGSEYVNASNIKAMREDMMSPESLQNLRKNMGLGDTLGPLPEENGGTGGTSGGGGGLNQIGQEIKNIKSISLDIFLAQYNKSYSDYPSQSDDSQEMMLIRDNDTNVRFFFYGDGYMGMHYGFAKGSSTKNGSPVFAETQGFTYGSAQGTATPFTCRLVDNDDGSFDIFGFCLATYNDTYSYRKISVHVTSDGVISSASLDKINPLTYRTSVSDIAKIDHNDNCTYGYYKKYNGTQVHIVKITNDGAITVSATSYNNWPNNMFPLRHDYDNGKLLAVVADPVSNDLYYNKINSFYSVNILTGEATLLSSSPSNIELDKLQLGKLSLFDPFSTYSASTNSDGSSSLKKKTLDVDNDSISESDYFTELTILGRKSFIDGEYVNLISDDNIFRTTETITYTDSGMTVESKGKLILRSFSSWNAMKLGPHRYICIKGRSVLLKQNQIGPKISRHWWDPVNYIVGSIKES